MEKIKIKHVGFDSWDREVFQTQKGTYVVDISLDYSHQNMRLCTKNNNEFDGEPDTALKTDAFEIVDDFEAEQLSQTLKIQLNNGKFNQRKRVFRLPAGARELHKFHGQNRPENGQKMAIRLPHGERRAFLLRRGIPR